MQLVMTAGIRQTVGELTFRIFKGDHGVRERLPIQFDGCLKPNDIAGL